MFENRLVNIMFIILIALTLIGGLALLLYTQFLDTTHADSEPTIDEIVERTVEMEELTTNLLSNHIIRSQFVFELDSDPGKNEFEKREFQVENIIIQELADMKESDFRGSEGIVHLEEQIRSRVNDIMDDGQVVQVYMNQRVIQ